MNFREQLEQFKSALQRISPIPDVDIGAMKDIFLSSQLKKGAYLLSEGKVCTHLSFVNQGLLKTYILQDGKEYIRQFIAEDGFAVDLGSFLSQSPSHFFIEALEDSFLLKVEFTKLDSIFESSLQHMRLGKKIAEQATVNLIQRNVSFIKDKAKTRYLNFLETRPELVQRVPQFMIASYLGITPEALSRIRKELSLESLS